MQLEQINEILHHMNSPCFATDAAPFLAEEDGCAYKVWKLATSGGTLVLKKIDPREREVYEVFFSQGGPVPKVFGFHGDYMLMEYIEGHTLSRCCRDDLILALDALIDSQKPFWNSAEYAHVGYGFNKSYPNREKRLPYLEDLTDCYDAYLSAFRTVPRTLCNDDLLPFNIMINQHRAVILDWEFGGILPYPCALARMLAFGEEDPKAMFFIRKADQLFAVDYYYDHLIREKGIPYEEYIRTLKLFFFKEYSEWIYCANSSGDRTGEYYRKYTGMARKLAAELGY